MWEASAHCYWVIPRLVVLSSGRKQAKQTMESKPVSSMVICVWWGGVYMNVDLCVPQLRCRGQNPLHQVLPPGSVTLHVPVLISFNDGLWVSISQMILPDPTCFLVMVFYWSISNSKTLCTFMTSSHIGLEGEVFAYVHKLTSGSFLSLTVKETALSGIATTHFCSERPNPCT